MSKPETTAAWVARQMNLLGIAPDQPGYVDALAKAEAGQPAWRIAQALGCSTGFIASLGGPANG